jgi:hypothetical protein
LPDARLEWIEECGHVPHLEQPDQTADAIANFLSSEVSAKNGVAVSSDSPPAYIVGAGFFGALAISEALALLSESSP